MLVGSARLVSSQDTSFSLVRFSLSSDVVDELSCLDELLIFII